MRDAAALRYHGPRSVPGLLKAQAERAPASSRLLWGLLIGYTLLVFADVITTQIAFSAAGASRTLPMWRWEWNPLMIVSGVAPFARSRRLVCVYPPVVDLCEDSRGYLEH